MADYSYWYRGEIVNSETDFEGTGNLTLDIKYIFTSFLQKFFENQTRYKWSKDVQATKIIVADKNAIDIGVVERRPSIIVSRGTLGWAYATRSQGSLGHNPKGMPQTLGDFQLSSEQDMTSTDLVRGSIVINCLAKYGLQAEELANLVFFAISSNKQKFYKRGMHSITGMSLGEENILRSTSDIELTAVPVSLQYSLVRDVYSSFSTFDIVLFYTPHDGFTREWYESSTFEIEDNGSTIKTYTAPAKLSSFTASYVEALTGETRTKVDLVGDIDGSNTVFTLPNSESALGYYKVIASGLVSLTQAGDVYPTDHATSSGLVYSGIAQDIYLSPTENTLYMMQGQGGSWDINYTSRSQIGNFQFLTGGGTGVSSTGGGMAEERGYNVVASGAYITGIPGDGNRYIPGSSTALKRLTTLSATSTPTGLTNIVITNPKGENMNFTSSGTY